MGTAQQIGMDMAMAVHVQMESIKTQPYQEYLVTIKCRIKWSKHKIITIMQIEIYKYCSMCYANAVNNEENGEWIANECV